MRQCKRCGSQQSITGGTGLANSKLPPWILKDVTHRVRAGDMPTTTELARIYQISRSTAWRLLQKIMGASTSAAAPEEPRTVMPSRLRVRRPSRRSRPVSPSAPPPIRELHQHLLRDLSLRPLVELSLSASLTAVELAGVAARGTPLANLARRRPADHLRAMKHHGIERWLGFHLGRRRRGLSLRWLPNWARHALWSWSLDLSRLPRPTWSRFVIGLAPCPHWRADPWGTSTALAAPAADWRSSGPSVRGPRYGGRPEVR
jgi:hypothetical protein